MRTQRINMAAIAACWFAFLSPGAAHALDADYPAPLRDRGFSQTGHWYPDRARRLGEVGVVMLRFTIDGGGAIQGVTVGHDANADLAQPAVSIPR